MSSFARAAVRAKGRRATGDTSDGAYTLTHTKLALHELSRVNSQDTLRARRYSSKATTRAHNSRLRDFSNLRRPLHPSLTVFPELSTGLQHDGAGQPRGTRSAWRGAQQDHPRRRHGKGLTTRLSLSEYTSPR